jgi:serine/threonine-protein kinase HipA
MLPSDHQGIYSQAGLRKLAPTLKQLNDLPFSREELVIESAARAGKMSVQGVQPKLSARLNTSAGQFEIVDQGGIFILKPPNPAYAHLPENEALTMRLAATVGIEVPLHGLVRGKDGTWTYFVRRFDRPKRGRKLLVEDFAQLSDHTRDTKYNSSMEQVAKVIAQFATYPAVEYQQLFRRVIFCFLTGGEDMHLKNWSLVTRPPRVQLAPGYDLINTTIALRNPTEELALPLNGKNSRLTRNDLVEYFAQQRLNLTEAIVHEELEQIRQCAEKWPELIAGSFLPEELKNAYISVVQERGARLWT